MPMKVIPVSAAAAAKVKPNTLRPKMGLQQPTADAFLKEQKASVYKDFKTIAELNHKGLSKLRDTFYHEYLLKLAFCNKDDIPRIQESILCNLKKQCKSIKVPPDIEQAKIFDVMKKEIVDLSAKSQILYEMMELNFQKDSATNVLNEQEENIIYLKPGTEEWNKSSTRIKHLRKIIDEQNERLGNYTAASNTFQDENLLRPMRLRSSVIWLNGNERDTESVRKSIFDLADNYWTQLLAEISPFEKKEIIERYLNAPYNKLYAGLKKIPGDNIYDSRKKVADCISKAFLDVLLYGETKNDGTKIKSFVDQFRHAFGKVNEASERILALALKRDEHPENSKDWQHFNNALIEARKDRQIAIMKNRAKLLEKDIDPGLYFQWMEPNRYELTPAAFFEYQRNAVLNKISELTGKSWTAAKRLLNYLQHTELPNIDKAWLEARNNNLKILEENGVTNLANYQDEFLREKLY